MAKLEGYRTILVMILALMAAVLQGSGIIVDANLQAATATAIVGILAIVMRLKTRGPVGGGSGADEVTSSPPGGGA